MTIHLPRRPWVAAALTLAVALAQAQSAPPEGAAGHGKPPGPPPEAVQACQGKKTGDSASFSGRDGRSMTGTCESVDGVLAVRPARGPGGGAGGPPPQ